MDVPEWNLFCKLQSQDQRTSDFYLILLRPNVYKELPVQRRSNVMHVHGRKS